MVRGDVSSELLDLVSGRAARPETGKSGKSRVSELFSDSSSEEEVSRSRVAPSSKNPNKRSAKAILHGGQVGEDDGYLSDGYGPDLMGDAEDRKRLAAMTEIEREAIIYERAQSRLARKERRGLEQKMRELEQQQNQGASSGLGVADRKRKSMESLRRARSEKSTGRVRRPDSDDDLYTEDTEGEEDGQLFAASATAPSAKLSRRGRRRGGDMSDAESQYEQSEDEAINDALHRGVSKAKSSTRAKGEPIDLSAANEMFLPRNVVAQWIFHPEFDEAARGMFVRLAVGMRENEQIYRPVEIKRIVKYHRTYKINGDILTNKAAILRYGQSEKTFRLDVISNSPITPNEFDRWLGVLREEKLPMLSQTVAKQRAVSWKNLIERPISDEVVKMMVAAKRELGAARRNLISERAMLGHLREEAVESGNADETQRIDEELAQLSKEIESAPNRTAGDKRLEALSELNRRNRQLNIVNAREAERKNAKKAEVDIRFDPFSRRKCAPSNFNSLLADADPEPMAKVQETADSSSTPAKHAEPSENNLSSEPKPATSNETADLFDAARKVDVDIDI